MIRRILTLPRSIFRRSLMYMYRKATLGAFGKRSLIIKPLKIDGEQNIFVGSGVLVERLTWLAAMPLTDTDSPRLELGDGCIIGHFNHIYCTNSIRIGRNVLTADKVYITDNLHSYEDVSRPVIKQPIKQIRTVDIGDGTWLGENVCVIGVHIGRGCVIGANSVVTKDIPDYSVAVGSPAKVIKQYNQQTKQWEKVCLSNVSGLRSN